MYDGNVCGGTGKNLDVGYVCFWGWPRGKFECRIGVFVSGIG